MARQGYRNPDCSVFVGGLDPRVTDELLWELFLQAGPVKSIHIPCHKDTGKQKAFGFVEFTSSVSAHYAWELLDGIKLFNRCLSVDPQQKDGEVVRHVPSNQMSGNNFYGDFYKKYEDLKRRPQSEPRRSRWGQDNYQGNRSFSYPFNRSLSSPSPMAHPIPWQQVLPVNTPPGGIPYVRSPFPYPMLNQTPPQRSYRYY